MLRVNNGGTFFLKEYDQAPTLSDAELEAARVFPLVRYLVALGRIVRLNTRFDGQQAVDAGRFTEWIEFMKRWIVCHKLLKDGQHG